MEDRSTVADTASPPQQAEVLLFRLPTEIRLEIYTLVLSPTKPRPLWIDRHIRVVPGPHNERSFLPLLLTCKKITSEAADILPSLHELQLCASPAKDAYPFSMEAGCIEDFVPTLQRARKIKLKIFGGGRRLIEDIEVLLNLLGWLKVVINAPMRNLEVLTLESYVIDRGELESRAEAETYVQPLEGVASLLSCNCQYGVYDGAQDTTVGQWSETVYLSADKHDRDDSEHPSLEEALGRVVDAWEKSLMVDEDDDEDEDGDDDDDDSPQYASHPPESEVNRSWWTRAKDAIKLLVGKLESVGIDGQEDAPAN